MSETRPTTWRSIALAVALLLTTLSAQAQPLSLSGDETQAALIRDADTGEVLYEYNARSLRTPASLTKLLTTAAALSTLGATSRYETRAYLAENQTNNNAPSLVVVGDGDPTFNSRYFAWHNVEAFARTIADSLKRLGIRQIVDIVADLAQEPSPVQPSKRLWEDMGNYFGAVARALNFADNSFTLTLRSPKQSGQKCQVVSTSPALDNDIECLVQSANTTADSAYIYGIDDGPMYVSGTIPAARERFDIRGALPNPPLEFCKNLRKALETNGITVDGEIRIGKGFEASLLVASSESPTIEAIAQQTNRRSINLFADALFLRLCTSEISWDAACVALKNFCRRISGQTPEIYDGSGLSPMNAVSPKMIVDVLIHMHASKNSEKFRSTLATAGLDGTLASFGRGTEMQGKVSGKSGTMHGVTAYAGYAKEKNGRNIAFCVIVNAHRESNSEVKQSIANFLIDKIDF